MTSRDFEGLQIFRLHRPRFHRAKSFADCDNAQRDEFALELFGDVEQRLDKLTEG